MTQASMLHHSTHYIQQRHTYMKMQDIMTDLSETSKYMGNFTLCMYSTTCIAML